MTFDNIASYSKKLFSDDTLMKQFILGLQTDSTDTTAGCYTGYEYLSTSSGQLTTLMSTLEANIQGNS
jgi:hypothetical protein